MDYIQQAQEEMELAREGWNAYEIWVDCWIDGNKTGDVKYVLAHKDDIKKYPHFREIETINDAPYREVFARDGRIHKVRA